MNLTYKGKTVEQNLDSIETLMNEKKQMIYHLLNYIQPSAF